MLKRTKFANKQGVVQAGGQRVVDIINAQAFRKYQVVTPLGKDAVRILEVHIDIDIRIRLQLQRAEKGIAFVIGNVLPIRVIAASGYEVFGTCQCGTGSASGAVVIISNADRGARRIIPAITYRVADPRFLLRIGGAVAE